MDFNITKDQNSANITINSAKNLAIDDVIEIYSAIRKILIKYYRMAPTLVPSNKHKDTITFSLLAGTEVNEEVLNLSIEGLKKYLTNYPGSHLPLDKYVQKIKNDFGVLDVDIATIKPAAWLSRKHELPHFAVAAHIR